MTFKLRSRDLPGSCTHPLVHSVLCRFLEGQHLDGSWQHTHTVLCVMSAQHRHNTLHTATTLTEADDRSAHKKSRRPLGVKEEQTTIPLAFTFLSCRRLLHQLLRHFDTSRRETQPGHEGVCDVSSQFAGCTTASPSADRTACHSTSRSADVTGQGSEGKVCS